MLPEDFLTPHEFSHHYHLQSRNYKMAESLPGLDGGDITELTSALKKLLKKFSPLNSRVVSRWIKRIEMLQSGSCSSFGYNESSPSAYSSLCPKETDAVFQIPIQDVEMWMSDVIDQCAAENWIKQVHREMPQGILEASAKGTLTDISVRSRGPDETVYNKHELLRKYVPRGFSLFKYENSESGFEAHQCVIFANRKFCGNNVDEDDFRLKGSEDSDDEDLQDANIQDKYFLSPISKTVRVIAMEKVNGEAAHFSGRYINGEFYLIAGSKNVHIMFQNKEHIDMYTEQRYFIAKDIAYALLEQWISLDEERRICLAQFLHLSRTTVVCEIMLPGHQHVVNFGTLDHNKLVVIALTSPPEEKPSSLTAMSSVHTLNFFSLFNFCVAQYEICTPDQVQTHIQKIRSEKNKEGIVYYYEDRKENTIGMVKLKSVWYIHLRALREQSSYRHMSKRKNDRGLEYYKVRSRNRMAQLQEWLYTTDQELQLWQEISDKWLEWVEIEVDQGRASIHNIKDNFPIHWDRFIQQSDCQEKASVLLK